MPYHHFLNSPVEKKISRDFSLTLSGPTIAPLKPAPASDGGGKLQLQLRTVRRREGASGGEGVEQNFRPIPYRWPDSQMGSCHYCEMRPLPVLRLKNRSATVGACCLDSDAKNRRDILGRSWTTWALTRSLFCVCSNAAITSPTKGRPPDAGGGVESLGTCEVISSRERSPVAPPDISAFLMPPVTRSRF